MRLEVRVRPKLLEPGRCECSFISSRPLRKVSAHMKRIFMLTTIALMLVLMVALSGAALAVPPGNAQGSGGHVEGTNLGLTFTGGESGSDRGSGGGGCITFLDQRECGGSGGPR